MIVRYLKSPNIKEWKFIEQDPDEAFYFPQRTPQDGFIDWNMPNKHIMNFVKALTRPYPGSESRINGQKIKIWSIIPFDIDISDSFQVGEIVKIFNKNDILIKTSESFMLLNDYELFDKNFSLKEGMTFDSFSFRDQMKNIILRHESKYPFLPISKEIKRLVE